MGQKCCSEIPQKDYQRLRQNNSKQPIHVPQGLEDVQTPSLPYEVEETRKQLRPFQPKSFDRPEGTPSSPKRLNDFETIYHGEWKNMQPHGLGIMYFSDGSIYQGIFNEGGPDLEGRLINTNGAYYEGDIRGGIANGKGKFQNKHKKYSYEGQWDDDTPHGFGKETWGDGTVYDGEFNHGVKQGNGTYFKKGDAEYIGIFQAGKIAHKGKMTCTNGDQYEGMFKNGVLDGYGTCRYRDGAVF